MTNPNQKEAELKFRGTVLTISIAFESSLMSIIYASNAEQFIKPYHKRLKIKGATFHVKLERVKEVLELYHQDLLSNYGQLLEDLDEFKEFRNRMAHCVFDWDKNQLNEFDAWDWSEDEDGFQYYKPVRYNIKDAGDTAAALSNKIVQPLTQLRDEIERRLKAKHPHLYQTLMRGDKPPEAN